MVCHGPSDCGEDGVSRGELRRLTKQSKVSTHVPWLADLVLIANTFHGVPDKARLATAVTAVLKPGGWFLVVSWHRRPREETIVLGEPRGPWTEMRMTPNDVTAVVKPAGLRLARVVELPPYHYGAIFEKPAAELSGNDGE
jgi:predicted methyltransferase